ncbi:hypothetical protein SUGI_0678660 [Cryptomeria japonica]|nr:hypothetical protein SUGI_0678660 [Cryptomeria japonica]
MDGQGTRSVMCLQTNLHPVLKSLAIDIRVFRFGKGSRGTGGDEVYGLAQCRADLTLSHCFQCFKDARKQLSQFCPTQNGGRVYIDGCFLRYENATTFTQPYDTDHTDCGSSSKSSADNFSEKTVKLLRETIRRAQQFLRRAVKVHREASTRQAHRRV